MGGVGVLLAHAIAHRKGKPPFFFSRYNFESMRKRGNTHYCFHCTGKWGFTPGKDGEPTNHMDSKIMLAKGNAVVSIRNALKDEMLNGHLAEESRCRGPNESIAEWRACDAYFEHSPDFEVWCEASGYTVHRFDPMQEHDPITHASGIVGGADKFSSAHAWLEASLPENFPLVVAVT